MNPGPKALGPTLALVWFRALLRCFSLPFRRRFGDSMEEAFADGLNEARSNGFGPMAAFLLRTTWDVMISGARERRARSSSPHQAPKTPRTPIRKASPLDAFKQDLIFAFRSLIRNPLFSVAAILTLGLGVGATTSMFSLVNGVVLRPLPYQDSERLIQISTERTDFPGQYFVMSRPDLLDVSELPAYEALAGYSQRSDVLTGLGDAALVSTGVVTSGLLEVFGLEPFMGRDIRVEESEPGARNVVVVGHDFWMNQLGADPSVLGRALELGSETFEIIGVAPPGFDFPDRSELWRPHILNPALCGRGCHNYNVLARLSPSTTFEQAVDQTEASAAQLREAFPDTNGTKAFHVTTLQEQTVGDVRANLWILLGSVVLVLLVACANVANLLLARAQGRGTEVGIRAAMGAGRGRLMAQILTESLVLSTMGGLLGLGMAFGGVALLKAFSPGNIPRIDEVGVDLPVLLFTLALTLVSALLFGLSPALGLARSSPAKVLRRSGRGSGAARPSQRTRNVLLAGEMALSVVLLVGAGLLLRTLGHMHDIQPGYQTEDVVRFGLTLPAAGYGEREQVTQFFLGLEENLKAVPGVASVGSAFQVPLGGGGSNGNVVVEGRPGVPGSSEMGTYPRPVTPGYLRTLEIPIIQGRELSPADDGNSLPVALVNQAFVNQHFPGEDPLGKKFRVTVTFGFQSPTWTIVGVVPDVHSFSLTDPPPPEVFMPLTQMATRSMTFVVRSVPGSASLLAAIRAEVQALDPNLPLRSVTTMQTAVAEEMAPTQFYLVLLTLFAGLAVVLAAVGLYGVVSYLVSLQRQEVGVRVALGADAGGIMRMFFRQASVPIGSGLLVGLGIALVSGRVLESFLYEVNPRDPLVFTVVTGLLVCVSFIAVAVPTQAATKISPTEAMRVE